ncbi:MULTISPECIES: hypothetical protein [Acidithiobacillus]|uniref:hypothetical protein n=1 Tax=Acidithiobacillus TaxID=119977 RepID=UPI0004E17C3F|nr:MULTISPECIES: hypothetical protein [Acidithiobacillus]MDD5278610.1 hypothetical protein [Acidithiobacillus sp.]
MNENLPHEKTPDIECTNSETAVAILSNTHHTVQIGTTRHGMESFEVTNDRPMGKASSLMLGITGGIGTRSEKISNYLETINNLNVEPKQESTKC